MSEVKCEKCGATIPQDKNYCPECGFSVSSEEEIIEGISNADLHSFIDNNSSRYIEILEKNKDKNIFVSFNISAGLFGTVWMCYRKMYKLAALLLAVNLFLSALLAFGFMLVCHSELKAFKDYAEKNGISIIRGAEMITADPEDGEITVGDVPDEVAALQDSAKAYASKASVLFLGPGLLVAIFADWLYREHIKRNKDSGGGVSVPAIFIGGVITAGAQSIAETAVLLLIMFAL